MANPISVPGTVVPSGSLISPGGAQGLQGLQGASGPNAVSTDAGNQSKLGSDSLIYTPGGISGFVSKTAAYTLTLADRNKYIICSGGSWTLTLPAPASGLTYQVRNDMGISGTVGTITLQPTGGTIDGAASLALLPQQECTVITDGTNWRTLGLKREVILGTLDITSAVASATVLLPAGYRLFLLDLSAILCSVDGQNLQMTFSSDSGSTFYSSNYTFEYFLNSALATITANGNTIAYAYVGGLSNSPSGLIQIKIYPGTSTQRSSWLSQSSFYLNSGGFITQALCAGFLAPTTLALMNAVKFVPGSGTINNMFLTVKGVV